MTQKLEERTTIDINEDYEVLYWSHKFNVSKQDVIEAVQNVGNSLVAVSRYLQKREPQQKVS